MKKIILFVLVVSSFGLTAQISTFDLDQKKFIYINYMPGNSGYDYDYSNPYDFSDQWNSLFEVGAILPVRNKLNANVGIGSTLGFQDAELFQRSTFDPGFYGYMGNGIHLKTGLSYTLQISAFQIMPNVGMIWNTESNYYWEWMPNDTYQLTEGYSGLWGVFDAGIDVVYKDLIVGLTYTDLGWYYKNYSNVGIKIGYALNKKDKMKF